MRVSCHGHTAGFFRPVPVLGQVLAAPVFTVTANISAIIPTVLMAALHSLFLPCSPLPPLCSDWTGDSFSFSFHPLPFEVTYPASLTPGFSSCSFTHRAQAQVARAISHIPDRRGPESKAGPPGVSP